MNIYLYKNDEIFKFILPTQITGSYNFDYDNNQTSKLINIEVRNGTWVIYSVEGMSLYNGKEKVDSLPIIPNTFYLVSRKNEYFLIFITDFQSDKLNMYAYNNLNITIGNTSNNTIMYKSGYLTNNTVKLTQNKDIVTLNQTNKAVCYVNNKLVKESSINLQYGDEINIYGLKIIYLKNYLLINNLQNQLVINQNNSIAQYIYQEDQPQNIIIDDKNLYNEKDYFSKAPRIRRIIEPKEIKFSAPPTNNLNEELPLMMTIGPMLTMGVMSFVMVIQVFTKVSSGQTTYAESWPQLIISASMLLSTLVWPLVTNLYNKRKRKDNRAKTIKKYDEYLAKKEKEFIKESEDQKRILIENRIDTEQCLNIINSKGVGFWDKRIDQNDFLEARLGFGNVPLAVKINYAEEEFTIEEDELRKKADDLVEKYKDIINVPYCYSFYQNNVTAIMSPTEKMSLAFADNILLQFLTFYSYEDVKFAIFTDEKNEKHWEYMKYSNHNFSNDKTFRFFASTPDSTKIVAEYFQNIINFRKEQPKKAEDDPFKPYYVILIDNYEKVKRFKFIKDITESKDNLGFSLIFIENEFRKLPSKCTNFITLKNGECAILQNSFENQKEINFNNEVRYDINMCEVVKKIDNIPIEFEEIEGGQLPNLISYLEMLKVGKIEQLNILNKWATNDSTLSLRAEIGVNEQEDIIYLDLHEKAHGPHGLIAGTTGSGKSEFIITYILSMCINYSPNDVSFILIDYKGGSLAYAFENKASGKVLPHLAGTITNLDKAEMNRTLVSIESELQRRQNLFNNVKDVLGESTMDIYKYQKLFKEGRAQEPVPHLFIICDEFAELKMQQPDFMDSLISTARIGRSLGVHLILATQKPTGIVNDQIWSNSRFRVCLKVQTESDSKEMLKRPEAAHIKETGRFYLQVGFDELLILGQSGWTGAKYYPSDKVVKTIDRSLIFLNECGEFIKRIQASTEQKKKAEGEQLPSILDSIINAAKEANISARKLWLENIPNIITVEQIEKKYNLQKEKNRLPIAIGEYDAPEIQKQGIVKYDPITDGNVIVYGDNSIEREMLISELVYSLSKNYTPEDINFYLLDFGSESLKVYNQLPHFAGTVTINEENRIDNLFNLLETETNKRKKLFAQYNGEYKNYIEKTQNKIPLLFIIINNFDSLRDNFEEINFSTLPEATRDSGRYGIVYLFTTSSSNSVRLAIQQNFKTFFTFKLKDKYEYQTIFNKKKDLMPRDILGRGIIYKEDLYEFQLARIVKDNQEEYINEFIKQTQEKYPNYKPYLLLPKLPEKVRLDYIQNNIKTLSNVPVGVSKNTVEIQTIDLKNNFATIIASKKLENTTIFTKSLIETLNNIKDLNTFIIDPEGDLNINHQNYYTNNFDILIQQFIDLITNLIDNQSNQQGIIIIYGLDRFIRSLKNTDNFTKLIEIMKKYNNFSLVYVDTSTKLKAFNLELWFKKSVSIESGIWIGNGITTQSLITISFSKTLESKIKNDMGYVINENTPTLSKLIDFYTKEDNY